MEQDTQKKPSGLIEESPRTIPVKRVRVPNFPVIYANGVQVVSTQWDVQFFFEQTIAPVLGDTSTEVVSSQQLAIVMSHEHAKMFLGLLQSQFVRADETGTVDSEK